jgi:ATP-binding cassette, subfamily G (WHITE), eye pigment precursor transporter
VTISLDFRKTLILFTVSGYVESGTLTAVIGGSGCGKTTLLAAISQRIRGNLTGDLLVNGCTVTPSEMTKLSGFDSQYDITIDSLTPKEHLSFMARHTKRIVKFSLKISAFLQAEMKMGRKVSKQIKSRQVNYLLTKLGLTKSADVRIASISGGERKKLNLATEVRAADF